MLCSQTVFLDKLSIPELHVFLLKYFQRFTFVLNVVLHFVHTMSPYAFCLTGKCCVQVESRIILKGGLCLVALDL